MKKRLGMGLRILALAILPVLSSPAESFFHSDDFRRLGARRFEPGAVERCQGDFLVFEEYQPEPHQPFLAAVAAGNFQAGAVEWNLRVRVEKGESLGGYVRRLGDSLVNYSMISQEAGGQPLCGLQHEALNIFVDVKERRVDVRGNIAKVSGGGNASGQ
ncbi:MAG: hypothetical protein HYZ11_01940 [Candidatus Tectomicrobia bacterium]|uniref:CHRD domain-containing protein n=1 Tax=Tectimicrobiota bacterium TaxID=2528274 RepID=A0A932HZ38_UNCTE|nr:hypothetical protein [Candidatus Tectomicrobia bacterium]